jgi:prepilin-type N-terminal cleavage/methylation domain-containing protein
MKDLKVKIQNLRMSFLSRIKFGINSSKESQIPVREQEPDGSPSALSGTSLKGGLHKISNSRKGYSLLEVVVSLGIIGILITMLFNVLIVTLNISFKLLTYSFVREEISNVVSLVSRDLRNADRIVSCGVEEAPNVCQIVLNGSFVSWEICGTGFCRYVTTNGTKNLEYRTSAVIQVNQITFQLDLQDSTIKNNMLMTIVAQHTNQSLNINNIYRQVSISTRNYDL